MNESPRIPGKLLPWFEARQRLKLSHASVQMARELGMNPKKLGKLVPAPGEQWKVSLPEFIARCYEKGHGRRCPKKVRSLEQVVEDEEHRKLVRREKRTSANASAVLGPPPAEANPHSAVPHDA